MQHLKLEVAELKGEIMDTPKYKRVLLKLSGEALKEGCEALSQRKLDYVTDEIIKLYNLGIEIAIVVGAGNICRGELGKKWGIDIVSADINGMIATMVNAGWIGSILQKKLGEDYVKKMNTLPESYCGDLYAPHEAKRHLSANRIVTVGGGNGIALCTTDNAAVQRAIEMKVDTVIMLKNDVDGVYENDPKKFTDSKLYKYITFEDFGKMRPGIIDEVAAIFACKHKMPIHFVNFEKAGAILSICQGEELGTYVGNVEKTEFYD